MMVRPRIVTVALYSIPITLQPPGHPLRTPAVRPDRVTVVIPFKDDHRGLRRTLTSLARMRPTPRLVRIVDDGSRIPLTRERARQYARTPFCLEISRLPANRGAAAARNRGLEELRGWVYLTDCACVHPPNLFVRLAVVWRAHRRTPVAVAGPVHASGSGRIARYMTEQGNLNPPMLHGKLQGVITANVLVHSSALRAVGGFDERFPSAGGEDIDLGLRLLQFGEIAWAAEATVHHAFAERILDFDRRFRRYGRGLAILADKWGANLTPYRFRAVSPQLQDLADRQFERMREGYASFHELDSHLRFSTTPLYRD